jgi:hypothetical protein
MLNCSLGNFNNSKEFSSWGMETVISEKHETMTRLTASLWSRRWLCNWERSLQIIALLLLKVWFVANKDLAGEKMQVS